MKADQIIKNAKNFTSDKDLLQVEHEGFSYNLPRDVFFGGKKVNTK